MSITESVPSREYVLIEKIKNECGDSSKKYLLGIGDDCAVRKASSSSLLISADTMVENVHFRLDLMSLREVGYKAIASSVSDIYAMAGTACSATVQLVFASGDNSENEILELYKGVGEAVKKFDIPIVGGDIASGSCWVIAVTVFGDAGKRVIYRNGAQIGDFVWVTGTPGLSALGLDLLLNQGRDNADNCNSLAVKAHVAPSPHCELADYLQGNPVTSLIDISDGVGKEALTIAQESGVSVDISMPEEIENKLTLDEKYGCRKAEQLFLEGGEDYELLFTAAPSFVPEFNSIQFSKVGVVTNSGCSFFVSEDNKKSQLKGGWDHI